MRKQTNTLNPSPKGFQSPKFSDSDFREVRGLGLGRPKSSGRQLLWKTLSLVSQLVLNNKGRIVLGNHQGHSLSPFFCLIIMQSGYRGEERRSFELKVSSPYTTFSWWNNARCHIFFLTVTIPETRNTRPPVSNPIMWQFEKQNVPPKLFFLTLFWQFVMFFQLSTSFHYSTAKQFN
jgi:hypothetical protein